VLRRADGGDAADGPTVRGARANSGARTRCASSGDGRGTGPRVVVDG
jgi:hypothetical protein